MTIALPYCLDPRPLCWECGELRKLKVVDGVGWLCLECRREMERVDE